MTDNSNNQPEDLTPQDEEVLNELINEAIHALFEKAQEKINAKTGIDGKRLSAANRAKLHASELALKMAERYTAHAKAQRLVDISNKALPTLTSIFGEQAVIEGLPPRLKNEKTADLCTRAGATELSSVIRKAIAPPTP